MVTQEERRDLNRAEAQLTMMAACTAVGIYHFIGMPGVLGMFAFAAIRLALIAWRHRP